MLNIAWAGIVTDFLGGLYLGFDPRLLYCRNISSSAGDRSRSKRDVSNGHENICPPLFDVMNTCSGLQCARISQ